MVYVISFCTIPLLAGEDKMSLRLEVFHTQPYTECEDRLDSSKTTRHVENVGMNLTRQYAHQNCNKIMTLCRRCSRANRSCCNYYKLLKMKLHYQVRCKSIVPGNNYRTNHLLLKRCRNAKPRLSFTLCRTICHLYSNYLMNHSKEFFDSSSGMEIDPQNSVFEINISDNSDGLVHETSSSVSSWNACQESVVPDSNKCSVQHLDNLPESDEKHEDESSNIDFQLQDAAWDVESISHVKKSELENSLKEENDLEYETDTRTHLDDLDVFENLISCGISENHCNISSPIKLMESSKHENCCVMKSNMEELILKGLDVNEIDCSPQWWKKRSEIFNDYMAVPQRTQQVYVLQADKPSCLPSLCVDTSLKLANKVVTDKFVEKHVTSNYQNHKQMSADTNDVKMIQTPSPFLTTSLSNPESNGKYFVISKDFGECSENTEPSFVQETDDVEQVEGLIEDYDNDKQGKETRWYENLPVEDIEYVIVVSNTIGYAKTSKILQVPKTQLLKWKRLLRKTSPLTKFSVSSSNKTDNTELTSELCHQASEIPPLRSMHPALCKKLQEVSFFKSFQPLTSYKHILDKGSSSVTSFNHDDIDNVNNCTDLEIGACAIIESDDETSSYLSEKFRMNRKCNRKRLTDVSMTSSIGLETENSCIKNIKTKLLSEIEENAVSDPVSRFEKNDDDILQTPSDEYNPDLRLMLRAEDLLESDSASGCTSNELTEVKNNVDENSDISSRSPTVVQDVQEDNLPIIPDSLNDFVKVNDIRIQHEHKYQKMESEEAECSENVTMHVNEEVDMFEEVETAVEDSLMSLPVEMMTEVEGRAVQIYEPLSRKELLKCFELFGLNYVSKKYNIPYEVLWYMMQRQYWNNEENRYKKTALIYGIPTRYCSYHLLKMNDLKNVAVCQFCQKLVDLRALEYHEVFDADFVKYVLQYDFFRQGPTRLSSSEIDFEISKVRSYIEGIENKNLHPADREVQNLARALLILQSKIGLTRICKRLPVSYSSLRKLKFDCKTFMSKLCCLRESVSYGTRKMALGVMLKMKIASYCLVFGDVKVRKFIHVGKSTLQLWLKALLDSYYDIEITDFTSNEKDELIKKQYLNEEDRFKLCLSVFNEPKFRENVSCRKENSKMLGRAQVISGVSEQNNTESRHVIQTTFPNGMEILLESDDSLDGEHCDKSMLDDTADKINNGSVIGCVGNRNLELDDDNKVVIDEVGLGLLLKKNNDTLQTVQGLIDVEKCKDKLVKQNEVNKDNVSDEDCDDIVEILSWNVDNGSGSCHSQEFDVDENIPEHDIKGVDNRRSLSNNTFKNYQTVYNSSGTSSMNKSDQCEKCDKETVNSKQLEQSVDTTLSTVAKPKLTVDINEVIYISDTEDECYRGDELLSPSEIKSEPFDEDFDAALRGRETDIVYQPSYHKTYRQPEDKNQNHSDRFEISQLGMGNENDKTSQGFGVQSNSGNSSSGACGSTPNLSYSDNFSGNANIMTDMPHNVQIVGANDLIPGEEYILLDPRVLSPRTHSVQTLSQPRIIRPPMRKGPTPVHIVQNLNVRSNLSSRCLSPSKPPPLRAYHSARTSLENIRHTATNSVSVQQSLLSGSIVYEKQYIHPSVPSSCSVILSSSPLMTSDKSCVTNTVTSTMSSPVKVVNTDEPLLPAVFDASNQVTEVQQLVSLGRTGNSASAAGSVENKTIEKMSESRDNSQHIVTRFKETPVTQVEQSEIKNINTTAHNSAMNESSNDTATIGKKLATSECKVDAIEVLMQKPALREPPKRLMKIISESEEYLEKEKLLLQTIKKQKESVVDISDGSFPCDNTALTAASAEVNMQNTDRITSLIERMVTRVSRQSSVKAIPNTNISTKLLNTSDAVDQCKPQTASQILFGSSTSPKKTQSHLKSLREESGCKESMNKPSTSGISGKRDLRKSPITTREIESSDESDEESSDESTVSFSSSETSDLCSNNSNNGGSEALSAKLKSILNADIFTVIDSGDENAENDKNDDENTAIVSQSERTVKQDKCLATPDKDRSLKTSAVSPNKEKLVISSSQELPSENEVVMKRSVHYSVGIRKKLAKLCTIFSMTSLHRKYGINIGTLSLWKNKYQNEDVKDLQLTQDELNEIESMKKVKENLRKEMEIRKDEGKTATAVPSDYQIYVDNPEEELTEETVHVPDLPSTPLTLSAGNKKPLWASKSKQPLKKKSVSNPLYFSVEADASEEVKSRVRENIKNVQGNNTKDSCGVFQSSVEISNIDDSLHAVKPDAHEEKLKKPSPVDDTIWEKTVYFCSVDGVFKYKYEPKKKTAPANENKEVTDSSKSVLDSLFNKHMEENSNRTDMVTDIRNQPRSSTDSSSSEIAEILRKIPDTKVNAVRKIPETNDNTVISPSDTGSGRVQYSDEFKSKIVGEARKSGFENTAKWFKVSIADIMKWHDSLLDESKQRNVTDGVIVECVDDTESESNQLDVPSRGNLGKINSNLSFERFQVKEGTIKKPKFNSNPVTMLYPTMAESLLKTGPSSPKQFRTRMGPNSIKFAPRTSSDQLHQFKVDVQGDLGIMPKFVKHSITKEKKDGIEIASTWKQVQSIINPPKISDKKFSHEYKNKIIRECEIKGQKTVSLEHKIPYNEISRWRLEAKRVTPPVKVKTPHGFNKADIVYKSDTAQSVNAEAQKIDQSFSEEARLTGEPESLKIKIKLSSISSLNKPKNIAKKQKTDKISNSNMVDKRVEDRSLKKAATNSSVQSVKRIRESVLLSGIEQVPGPVDEDIDHRMEVINFCFEHGVLKTQKRYNVTRQSIIDLMKEYDELNKFAVDKYNQSQGFKTKLVSREKTSVEVTNMATKPVIVKNLNDYIVTPEYMQVVVDYAVKHGITAASRKFKRKTSTVRSWINQFQKEEKKKISVEQVAKEQELLAANVSLDEARKISVLEARRKRQLLEAEFRRHIIEFAREFGITAASRRFKKKASTVKSWMGHFAKSERDAKRLEGASKLQNPGYDSGNLIKGISGCPSLSTDTSNTAKVSSPPCSPIWEQDFVIKPSSSESPLKLTLSPRRKSVIVIDSSCEEETQDEETNDIVTEDEQESDFVELAAWEFEDGDRNSGKDNSVNNSISKSIIVNDTDNSALGVIDVGDDGKKLEEAYKNAPNREHEATDVTEDNSEADVVDDLTTDKIVPKEIDNSDQNCELANDNEGLSYCALSNVETAEDKNVKANTQTSCDNYKVSEMEEKISGESMETDSEEIPLVGYFRNTLMNQVYTDEVDAFFLNENMTLKYKVRKACENSEKHVHNPSHEDTKVTCTKKFRKYADAEIMQNIDETCLFNETRLTRNTVKPPVGAGDTDKDRSDEDKELDANASDDAKSELGNECKNDSAIANNSTEKLNNSGYQIKTERSLFDILANESEVSSNTMADLSLHSVGVRSDNRHQGLFGSLLKNFQIPSSCVKDTDYDSETTKDANDVNSEKMPHKTEKIPVVENKPKDISERNLFDFITPETGKEEPLPTPHSSNSNRSIYKSDKNASVTLQNSEKSSEHLPKQRKPMFKFPKLASQFNFGNIAKLGMAKIKGENKEIENQNSVTPETERVVKVDPIDIPVKPQEEKKVEVSSLVKAGETSCVVMETFEELRKRLAQERAAMKLLKEKTAKSLDEEKNADIIEEFAEKNDDKKPGTQLVEEIDYEMYKDFSPQKIILILDISKKHGVEFASTSFGLPVPVIVNWIIEKDRKHRKVALSVTLEEKLRILGRMIDIDKEKLANELGHKVSDFDQWENEVGWMIHNKGVCDVLKKWQTVESVVSLNFEEKTKNTDKKIDDIENPSLSCNLKCREVDSEGGNEEITDVKDISMENPTESLIPTTAVNNVPDILDFVRYTKPRDFTLEQKAIIVLLSEKYGSCSVSKKTGVNQGTLFNWRHRKSAVQQYLHKQSGESSDEKQSPKIVEQQRDKSNTFTLRTLRETRSSSTQTFTDVKEKKTDVNLEKVSVDIEPARWSNVDSDEENNGRKGYRVISPSKLPSVLKNMAGTSGKDYTLEQKVAVVKLVELYGVRTIHKQFHIPAGSIWNWQHSKAVTHQLRSSVVEETYLHTGEEADVVDGKFDEPFSIDSILDRSLIVSDSVNHLNFQLDQKADVVFLIQHFGCDYVCEKMPQIPRGTLWNWRHNKNILSLVEKLNSKVQQHSKAFSGNSLIEETVNKTDLTQKWLKDLQHTTLATKRKVVDDLGTKRKSVEHSDVKVKKTSQGFDASGCSKVSPRFKPKIGPKCSKRNQRSLSPSTLSSEISVHSNDVEEFVSDDEQSSVMSKRSSGSSKTVQSEQSRNKFAKESSPNKSDVSSELETHSVKFEVVKSEIESSNRMMVCYKCDNSKYSP